MCLSVRVRVCVSVCVFESVCECIYMCLCATESVSKNIRQKVFEMPAIRDFFENGLFLWIKPEDLLCYTEEDAKQDLASGTAKVFIRVCRGEAPSRRRPFRHSIRSLADPVKSQKDRSNHQLPHKESSRGGKIELFLQANEFEIPMPDWS